MFISYRRLVEAREAGGGSGGWGRPVELGGDAVIDFPLVFIRFSTVLGTGGGDERNENAIF